MEQKVMRFIQEKQLLQKHKKIIIGLSGGPDSVALLHFLKGLRERWHLEVIAITINHQLRGEAACEDVNYTKQICSEWDVPLIVREVNVQQYARKHKLGIQ